MRQIRWAEFSLLGRDTLIRWNALSRIKADSLWLFKHPLRLTHP